ncbi:MAG: tyrosine recombinase XerC [Candidatus Glassbacteria bacterium]
MNVKREEIENFVCYLDKVRNLSTNTLSSYARDLNQFTEFIQDHYGKAAYPFGEVDPAAMRSFLGYLRRSGCGRRSLARKLASVRTFYDFLQREGSVSLNPARAVSSPRQEKRLPEYLSIEEVRRAIESQKVDTLTSSRNRAIVEVLYSTGIRVSELTSMNVQDIDLINESIKVRGKRKKERFVTIGSVAIEALMKYITLSEARFPGSGRGGYRPVFLNRKGERLGVRQIQRIVGRCFEQALLRKGFSPHSLRHAFATHLLERGADIFSVKELLGHASLSSTQIYTRLTSQRLLEAHRKSHPRK